MINISRLFIERCLSYIPDHTYIRWRYFLKFGRFPNLKKPQTYNEKLQWLKLYDRNPFYTKLVDKIEVKKWVAKQVGEKYVIPTIGVWDNADSIDLQSLPNKFVLKTNHDSGGLYICKEKSKAIANWKKISQKINNSLKTDYYLRGREWPYKNVSRKIFAEKLLESGTDEISDYKFFCLDGVPQFLFVATDRQKKGEDVKFDFFDINYNWLPIKQGHENAKKNQLYQQTMMKW